MAIEAAFETPDISQTIAANIRGARERAWMTQRRLALELGIGAPRVNDYERGRIRPTVERLAEIARITGAPSVGWFYDPHERTLEERVHGDFIACAADSSFSRPAPRGSSWGGPAWRPAPAEC